MSIKFFPLAFKTDPTGNFENVTRGERLIHINKFCQIYINRDYIYIFLTSYFYVRSREFGEFLYKNYYLCIYCIK